MSGPPMIPVGSSEPRWTIGYDPGLWRRDQKVGVVKFAGHTVYTAHQWGEDPPTVEEIAEQFATRLARLMEDGALMDDIPRDYDD